MAGEASKAGQVLPAWFGPFAPRPRLVLAMAGGLAVGLACVFLLGLQTITGVLVGWDALCLGFILGALPSMADRSPEHIRARAAREDQGQPTILALVLLAAAASIAAIALELSSARHAHGVEQALRIALAFGTVAASWFMVHLIFALHYAHGYYARDPESATDAGGLAFPGGQAPDYWDFLHFAVIIGVASQTADVAITSKRLRRLNTVHSLFAFAFNTVVVALTINLLAGLFG